MQLTVIEPPPFEPVSLQECYDHLRLDPDLSGSPAEATHPDDAMLAIQIAASRQYAEQFTHRAFVKQRIRLTLDHFRERSHWDVCPTWLTRGHVGCWIDLLRPPIVELLSVSYYDGDNALQPVDAAYYYVADGVVPQLRFVSGFAVPMTYLRGDAVRVDYYAGYPPVDSPPATQADFAANVPAAIKGAILIGVELLHDNSQPQDRERLEMTRDALLRPYVVPAIP